MCGIIASFDTDFLCHLYGLNAYRGRGAISISLIKPGYSVEVHRKLGSNELDQEIMDMMYRDEKAYKILHVQSPTSTDRTFCHPSELSDTLLWHNGIIKESDVKRLQSLLGTEEEWDTALLHRGFIREDVKPFLSSIDGSFACLYHSSTRLYAFRNNLCPLFVDDNLNISSVMFEGSHSLPAGDVHTLDLKNRLTVPSGILFDTLNDPYN